jgi:hypothetical protein
MSQPELRDALFIPSDYRENFKQVIAKRSDLVRYSGGRLAPSLTPSSGVATFEAGTVLGFASTGGDAGYYKAYNSANTDGSQIPAGVLSEQAVVDSLGNGSEIAIIQAGDLYQSALIGFDTNAQTVTGSYVYNEHGVAIVGFRI